MVKLFLNVIVPIDWNLDLSCWEPDGIFGKSTCVVRHSIEQTGKAILRFAMRMRNKTTDKVC